MQKYEQVKVLGQGGFGKAILAKRKADNVQVVIKEVRLTALTPKDRDEALKEVKVLAALKHPYIVEYNESFQERGCLYIVMGYADGGDLAQKIEKAGRKLFTEEEILHDFIEMALAIKYIHDRKILHRDLKGQNVFLMKDGTVKLGDFGIARVLDHTFQLCRTQIGTPYYLSPEICQGRNYNMKTDIWSLGCILYEMCTLKHAFEAGNMNQLLMNIVRGRYAPIPQQYSADLRNLVDRMLTKEPEKRPTINQILATPFLKDKLSKFLEKTMLDYEMQHTIIHGRKPFQAPTMIIKKDPPAVEAFPAANGAPGAGVAGLGPSGFTQKREEQRKKMEELEKRQKELDEQIKKRDAELKKKEEELKKQNEQKKREMEARDAELKKKEEEIARREREERARVEAKEKELLRMQQMQAKAEFEKREADLKRQEELIARREREEKARLDAKEKLLQQQQGVPIGGIDYTRRNNELKRKEEELQRKEREDMAKLEAKERALQQQRAAAEKFDFDRRAAEIKRREEELARREREDKARLDAKERQIQAARADQDRRVQQQRDVQERANYEKKQREIEDKKNRIEQERLDAEKRARQNEWEERNRAAMEIKNRDRGGPFAYDAPANPPQRNRNAVGGGNPYDRGGGINDDDRKRAFMEQQAAAAANRARQQVQAADCFRYDDPEPPRRQNPVQNKRDRQKDEDAERMRIYMEQRREAMANRDRHRNQDMNGGAVMDALRDPSVDDHYERANANRRNMDKQKRAEEEEAERRRIFMEQKRAAQANRDRMRQMEMGGGAVQEAIMRNDPDDDSDEEYRRRNNKKKQQEMDDEERRRIFMEQKRAAQANRDRMRQMEMGGGAVQEAIMRNESDSEDEERKHRHRKKKDYDEDEMKEFYRQQRHEARKNRERLRQAEYGNPDYAPRNDDDDDDEPKQQKKKQMDVDEINAYMREQRHIARANKARAQAAEAESQFEKDLKENAKDDDPLPKKKKQMDVDEINAYMREQRHIARANKARAQAAEAESQFEKDLKENAKDDEPLPQKKKQMDVDEINAYMREQRHIARANKARAQAAEAESQFEKDLKENAKDDEPLPQKKKQMDVDEINAYMREQRHIARANKARAQAAEAESQFEKDLKENAKDDEPLPQKKKEMNLDEINAYMREQRHIARANRERAMQVEHGAAANDDDDDDDDEPPPPPKKKEMSLEEINAFMREQRHARRANRAKAEAEARGVNMDDLIRQAEAEQRANPKLDKDDNNGAAAAPPPEEDNEPPPQKEKKPEMSLAEINAFMREQRHARRANRAKAEAELAGVNMDDLIRQAEAEQRANPKLDKDDNNGAAAAPPPEEDNEPPPQKEKKPEMSLAEINAFMREQRHARRANRAKAEAELAGVNMDDLIRQAEAEQRANPKLDKDDNNGAATPPPDEEDDEPPPQKEKKPEMSLAEINAFMREQRHARRANRAKAEAELAGVNMDDLIRQAEAEQRANPQAVEPAAKPAPEPKPEPKPQPKPEPVAETKPSSIASEGAGASKLTIAEARRQALAAKKAKLSQQEQPQVQQSQQEQPLQKPQQHETESAPNSARNNGSEPLLDRAAMKQLFAQQRNEIRLNRERIKAAQDGSHDPNLMPKRAAQPPAPTKVPQVNLQPSSARAQNNPLKTSARRILSNISPRKPTFAGQQPQPSVMALSDGDEPAAASPIRNDSSHDSSGDSSPVIEKPKMGRFDLSQALNSKSAGEFLKSRSIVLDELKTAGEDDLDNLIDDIGNNKDESNENDEFHNDSNDDENNKTENENQKDHEEESQLSGILQQAKLLNDALDINEDEADNEAAAETHEETSKNENVGGAIDQPQFFLQNKVLNFPVVKDSDSLSYRAEAIRAFLEREVGLDKVIALKQAVLEQDAHSVNVRNILDDVEPGIVVLAQQLLILDECVDQVQI